MDGGTSLRVGMTHELSQVGSVLCSCFFTGRNAAILFGKASEFSIYCEYLSKCSFKKTQEIQDVEIIVAYTKESQDLF